MIPQHTRCQNCGMCCYFVLATPKEIRKIKAYVKKNNVKPIKYKEFGKCIFRDDKEKKCLIYPVRPTICQLLGVTKGMICINGNTTELDMKDKLDYSEAPEFINQVKWE